MYYFIIVLLVIPIYGNFIYEGRTLSEYIEYLLIHTGNDKLVLIKRENKIQIYPVFKYNQFSQHYKRYKHIILIYDLDNCNNICIQLSNIESTNLDNILKDTQIFLTIDDIYDHSINTRFIKNNGEIRLYLGKDNISSTILEECKFLLPIYDLNNQSININYNAGSII